MHITIFVSRRYDEDDCDDQVDDINDCGTMRMTMRMLMMWWRLSCMLFYGALCCQCTTAAFCTQPRESDSRLLSICTESGWCVTQPACRFEEEHSVQLTDWRPFKEWMSSSRGRSHTKQSTNAHRWMADWCFCYSKLTLVSDNQRQQQFISGE